MAVSVLVESADVAVHDALAMLDRALDVLQSAMTTNPSAQLCETALVGLERHGRRVAAVRMKVVTAASQSRVAQDAGFASPVGWVASRTRTPRSAAARQVALAGDLESGYDATAAALEEGLFAGACGGDRGCGPELPVGSGPSSGGWSRRRLSLRRQRLDPDQLRRRARRVLETVEPDVAWWTPMRTGWCAPRRRRRGRSAR